jgi:hypothetical protein
MAPSSTATDLKRRLEHARRRQREVEQGRAQDESGVRQLVRDPLPQLSSASIPPVIAPVALTRRHLLWRGALLLLVGGLIGAWLAHTLGPISFVDAGPASVSSQRRAPALPPAAEASHTTAIAPMVTVRSVPDGAEIVFRGAVIANTPARVPRPTYPALYLLRRSGYHPQLVRVSPQSGDVVVDLKPLRQELPSPSSTTKVPRTKPKPDRARGHDVGR